jgi:catechol 2,3-dioxygenase-like lactoylglutathione lyase family enzyme
MDRITANLPSRDFDRTEAFYGALGFERSYRGDGWMILKRRGLELEFFPHPDCDPKSSWFSTCLRLDDPEALLEEWRGAGLPGDPKSIPRLTGFFKPPGAPRMFALVDEDGSLLRCIDNRDAG